MTHQVQREVRKRLFMYQWSIGKQRGGESSSLISSMTLRADRIPQRLLQRQIKSEICSLAWFTVKGNMTAMFFNNTARGG